MPPNKEMREKKGIGCTAWVKKHGAEIEDTFDWPLTETRDE